MADEQPTLNARQIAFCEYYTIYLNATKAALSAGYSEKTAYSIGARLLKQVEIKAHIAQLLEEKTIKREEILARLSEMATFDIGDITDSQGNVDFTIAKEHGLTRAIKSIKRKITKDGEEHIEYELYDAQAALVHLGRAYSLFGEKPQKVDGGEWRSKAIADIEKGLISFEALAQAFDHQTARELFTLAGKADAIPTA